MTDKILVVDLYSGRYNDKLTGFELFNLDRNPLDDKYYGYVPPKDGVDIDRIEAGAKESVSDVLIVYVKKVSETDNNREIIAYCENATVFRKPQPGDELNRKFEDKDGTKKIAHYNLESNNLTDLRNLAQKFTIEIARYNSYMFRMQRSYLEQYPQLKADILAYIAEQKVIDQDDGTAQANIQSSAPASAETSAKHGMQPDERIKNNGVWQIKKNPTIAKKVLHDNNYKCLFDESHTTFMTNAGVWYMEGHHLIPCTVDNSEKFKNVSRLDREENIVCICPNCHRAIHYGDATTKTHMIETLYKIQLPKLTAVGFDISLDELLNLYGVTASNNYKERQ